MHWIREPTRIDRGNDIRKYDANEGDIQQAESECIIIIICMTENQLIIFRHPSLCKFQLFSLKLWSRLKEKSWIILRIEKKSLYFTHFKKWTQVFTLKPKKCTIFKTILAVRTSHWLIDWLWIALFSLCLSGLCNARRACNRFEKLFLRLCRLRCFIFAIHRV